MTDSEQSVRIAFNHCMIDKNNLRSTTKNFYDFFFDLFSVIPVFTSRVLKFGQAGTELLMTFIRNIQKSKQALPRTDSDIQITLLVRNNFEVIFLKKDDKIKAKIHRNRDRERQREREKEREREREREKKREILMCYFYLTI
jgi:hypothetical protein